MTASASQEFTVPSSAADALARAKAALAAMGATLTGQGHASLSGKLGFSLRSFGEALLVEVSSLDGGHTRVKITSTSRLKTTLVAWGKHKANLREFMRAVPWPKDEGTGSARSDAALPSTPGTGHAIFISYRRNDSADVTGRIYDRLCLTFDKGTIFKDVDSIGLGQDFRSKVREALGKCVAFLPVIGPRWTGTAADKDRISEANDWVRLEVETALEKEVSIIPLFVHGATMPHELELPAPLRPLAFRNGLVIQPDPDFTNDMNRLIAALRAIMER